jgi:hypothetical protein
VTGISLEEPPSNVDDLIGFPVKPWDNRFVLTRVCLKDNGTWWFSNDTSGRFDPVGVGGVGTCYFGTDAIAAILEVFRKQPVVRSDIDARTLRRVRLKKGALLADTTKLRARRFGITKEIATIVPYDICQRWARLFVAADFGGIFHHLRHDVRPRATGVSLFGPAGVADADDWEDPSAELRALTDTEIRRAGLTVLSTPRLSTLHVVK